ncbi:hypothetical protein CONLIGDRAFT_458782 [Coniochaeta ligniaria NRRL 30616]|uniref:Uncharacterized protein n=1 Tax=Coniochaeta ligniaria NRRL 30616 TaxID=1408157 RepID=A0A1J7JE82_9PEZI|nr:hypothetical protein CONLIGDRAFT_458782 [Coniochaeta ligniaria NRRL 30616]
MALLAPHGLSSRPLNPFNRPHGGWPLRPIAYLKSVALYFNNGNLVISYLVAVDLVLETPSTGRALDSKVRNDLRRTYVPKALAFPGRVCSQARSGAQIGPTSGPIVPQRPFKVMIYLAVGHAYEPYPLLSEQIHCFTQGDILGNRACAGTRVGAQDTRVVGQCWGCTYAGRWTVTD